MNLPEYNTTNCEEWKKYYGEEEFVEAIKFMCPVCGRIYPDKSKYYWINYKQIPICKKHTNFHKTYEILEDFEHETIGNEFNALSVTLKLNEEGII